ncbi:uncharacterized protein LOC130642352 [Hydractinia symbiolongicarpus]|uniref:uncharacterized protein LOC130642352 n=1 Tax=Hydractinia symbiolongicarpus TaxID=13093 RepID=UPI00254BDE76|nr:uncharacterized protein LOC130642352 [Hydractinia symbiolongicarpus]
MERYMKPNRLSVDPSAADADRTYKHWFRTFENFIHSLSGPESIAFNKLNLLINYIDPNIYKYISECDDFENAIQTLKELYVKPNSVILARHVLSTRKQKASKTLDQFLNELKTLAKECDFHPVSAEEYKSEMIRDAFINRLSSNIIRQRLLENRTLDLQTAFDKARALDVAQQSSSVYSQQHTFTEITAALPSNLDISTKTDASNKPSNQGFCCFCGNTRHPRSKCPAHKAICHKCKKVGHFEKLCRSTPAVAPIPSYDDDFFIGAITAPTKLSPVLINDTYKAEALIDSGCTDKSFIGERLSKTLNLRVTPAPSMVEMALTALSTKSIAYCQVSLAPKNRL